jgi:hypothetical protein
MLFDLTFTCYLTTYSGNKCLSGKVTCAFFCPPYRNSPVQYPNTVVTLNIGPKVMLTEVANSCANYWAVNDNLSVNVSIGRHGIEIF